MVPLDGGSRTDGEDLPVLDRDGLGGRLLVVDGDDVAARVDRVGDLGPSRAGRHEQERTDKRPHLVT